MALVCALRSIPPAMQILLIPVLAEALLHVSSPCIANSLVGARTRMEGCLTLLIFLFSAKILTIPGTKNPSVFPDPVSAIPITSLF